jgi:hypothetical protein
VSGGYEDFIERLEAALADDEGREDFLEYLQGLTREGRAEILAEADRLEAKPKPVGRGEAEVVD